MNIRWSRRIQRGWVPRPNPFNQIPGPGSVWGVKRDEWILQYEGEDGNWYDVPVVTETYEDLDSSAQPKVGNIDPELLKKIIEDD